MKNQQFTIQMEQVAEIGRRIMAVLMQFRRITRDEEACAGATCQACVAPHWDKIIATVRQNKPIRLVLPAFPGKSPNPAKVLGSLPDMGEQLALEFLNTLCHKMGEFYPPGAQVILCSDGRVFSDVIGMSDALVSAYQRELIQMIPSLSLT